MSHLSDKCIKSKSISCMLIITYVFFVSNVFGQFRLENNIAQQNIDSIFRKAPYLLYVGDNSTMKVSWQLEVSDTCLLQWGADTTYSSGSVQTIENGTDHLHAHIITALIPGTKYLYKVICENLGYSGSFNSAPEENSADIKFFIIGDTRTHYWTHDSISQTMISVYSEDTAFQSLIIAIGDLIEFGAEEFSWQNEFFNDSLIHVRQRMADIPFVTCLGNHEIFYENYTNYNLNVPLFKKYFSYPFAERTYWSFDYGNIHFAIVDQYPADYSPYGQGLLSSDVLVWLENDLSSTDKPWKLIVLHEPGWSAGGSSSGSPHYNNPDVQDLLQPLCEQFGVQMVIAGHNHYYARAYKNGVCHLTSAGGGAPIYSPDPQYPNVVITRMENHFCMVDVRDTILSVSVVNIANDTIDEFSFFQNIRPGHLLGFVVVDSNTNVEDVIIETNGLTTNPDEIGYYGISLEEGFYDVFVTMPGNDPQFYGNVEILQGSETTLDINLITFIKQQISDDDFNLTVIPTIFSETLKIKYHLPENGLVSICMYDCTGRLITQLPFSDQMKGNHQSTLITSGLAQGIYIVKIMALSKIISRKVLKQ